MSLVLNRTEHAIDLNLEYKGQLTTYTIPPAQLEVDGEGEKKTVSGRAEIPEDFLKECMKKKAVEAHFSEKRLSIKKDVKTADGETVEQKAIREQAEADATVGNKAPAAPAV